MAVSYLHGAEVIEKPKGAVPVKVVKTAVLAFPIISSRDDVGANKLTWIANQADADLWGDFQLEGRTGEGYTGARAIKTVLDYGVANILVVDVADATSHRTAVTAESKTVDANGFFKTTYIPFKPGVNAVTVTTNASPPVTLDEGTDYEHDGYGNFKILPGGAMSVGDTVLISYYRCNFSAITSSVVIGTVNNSTGAKTGLKCYQDSWEKFGFLPKLFVAPKFSQLTAVAAELQVLAENYKAVAFIDAPYGTSVATAIAGRGIGGSINFYTQSDRVGLCFDSLVVPNPADLDTTVDDGWLSLHYAACQAYQDNNVGYWNSASNVLLRNVFGTKFPKASNGPFDPTSHANQLNEAGIITVQDGPRTWGNRSAAWPTVTAPKNFISVRRTADVVYESLTLAMLQFIDKPIDRALIDSIRESGNAFIRTLIQRGALIVGSNVSYDPAKNPPTEIALGHLTFDINLMPPVPGERITFEAFIDINLLNNLNAAV